MNRKGFTLIELLAVIILIALIAVLIVPNIIDTMTKSKEASYQLLVKNIVTSAKTYYEEHLLILVCLPYQTLILTIKIKK